MNAGPPPPSKPTHQATYVDASEEAGIHTGGGSISSTIAAHLDYTYPLGNNYTGKETEWLLESGPCPEDLKPHIFRYLHQHRLYNIHPTKKYAVKRFMNSLADHLRIKHCRGGEGNSLENCKTMIVQCARAWSHCGLLEGDPVLKRTKEFNMARKVRRDAWVESLTSPEDVLEREARKRDFTAADSEDDNAESLENQPCKKHKVAAAELDREPHHLGSDPRNKTASNAEITGGSATDHTAFSDFLPHSPAEASYRAPVATMFSPAAEPSMLSPVRQSIGELNSARLFPSSSTAASAAASPNSFEPPPPRPLPRPPVPLFPPSFTPTLARTPLASSDNPSISSLLESPRTPCVLPPLPHRNKPSASSSISSLFKNQHTPSFLPLLPHRNRAGASSHNLSVAPLLENPWTPCFLAPHQAQLSECTSSADAFIPFTGPLPLAKEPPRDLGPAAALAQTRRREPELQFILEKRKGLLDWEYAISKEDWWGYKVPEIFHLAAIHSLQRSGSLSCLTLRYDWGRRDAILLESNTTELQWEKLKKRIWSEFLIASAEMPDEMKFHILVKSGDLNRERRQLVY